MIWGIIGPRHSGMPMSTATDPRGQAPAALSPKTLELWLAAARYRRRADELASADSRRPAP